MSKCEEKLLELAAALEEIATAAQPSADIMAIRGNETIIKSGDTFLVASTKKGTKVGDRVLIDGNSKQIIKKLDLPGLGPVVKVSRRLDDETIEVAVGGQTVVVYSTLDVKPGDSVLLSMSAPVAISIMVKEKETTKLEIPNVPWAHIAGQEQAKHELREAVEYPRKFASLWKHYNKRIPKGILLFGPPGCGKTMLGRAVATAIGSSFTYAKGPEILDPYVGVTEQKLRALLQEAKSGGIIFIDEADAILGARGTRNSFMEKTVVPTFLTEVDGIEEFKGTVILATNRPDTLDPAVLRDGRIDRKIEVARPDDADTRALFGLYLAKVPTEHGGKLAERGTEMVFDQSLRFPSGKPFSSLASGALVAGIVDKAVSSALARDMQSGKPSKVCKADLEAGVMSSFNQNEAVFLEAA